MKNEKCNLWIVISRFLCMKRVDELFGRWCRLPTELLSW